MSTAARRDAALFSGQGTQYVGMGQELAEARPEVQALMARADAVLGVALSRIMLEGPAEALTLTENTQPAILTLAMAHWGLLEGWGMTPVVALGHSLGEYAAWVAAGSLAFDDALGLVRLRGQAMQEAVPVGVGAMSAIISAPADEVEALCAQVARATGQVVRVSVYNCPGNTVISGHAEAVAAVGAQVEEARLGVVKPLEVSAPFHCELLEPAARRLEQALARVEVRPNALPVIPNVTAEVVAPGADPDDIRAWLVEQVVAPVRWEESLRAALALGATRALSLGPGEALKGHMKRVSRRFPMMALDLADDRAALEQEASDG